MPDPIPTSSAAIQAGTMPDNDISSIAAGAGVSFVGKMLGKGMQVLGQALLARFLGPELFGLYAIGVNLLRTLGLVAPLGLDQGVVHFAARYWPNDPANIRRTVFRSLGFAILSSLIVATALLASAMPLEQAFQKPGLAVVLRYIALGLPFMAGLMVAAAATTVSQKVHYAIFTREFAQPLLDLVLILALGWQLLGAVAALVLSFVLAFCLSLYYLGQLWPKTNEPQTMTAPAVRPLLAFSLPATLAGAFTHLTHQVDRLLVGYLRPVAEVGVFQAVSQSSVLFLPILGAFDAIFSPLIASMYYQQDKQRLDTLYKVITKWALYLSLPVFFTIAFAPREFLVVVFGPGYEGGHLALVILSLAQLLNVATGSVAPLLIMTGHQNKWLKISALSLLINVGLNWLLVPNFGLVGAAMATTAAIVILFLTGVWQVQRHLGLWPYDKRYVKGILAALLTVLLLILLEFIPFPMPLLNLMVTGATSVTVFGLAMWLLGVDDEDRRLILLIRARLGYNSRPVA